MLQSVMILVPWKPRGLIVIKSIGIILSLLVSLEAAAVELVIGEERVSPGIVFIFEGAVKDTVVPASGNLSQGETDVHIEARVNWDEDNLPPGTPPGGFVPYLDIFAKVVNQRTGRIVFADVEPHMNLIDNFHYARNIALPGYRDDLYTVIFTVTPPSPGNLALHRDWVAGYGSELMLPQTFTYQNVDFEDIANATRD